MEKWYKELRKELKTYLIKEDINMLEYYKFSSTCYAITEYIFNDLQINTNKKSQELNKSYDIKLNYIYNPRYIYNDLKHMIFYEDDKWQKNHELNFMELACDLKSETTQLIMMYSARNVKLSKTMTYKEILDINIMENMNIELFKNLSQAVVESAEMGSTIMQPVIARTEMVSAIMQPVIARTEMVSTIMQPVFESAEMVSTIMQPMVESAEMVSTIMQPVVEITEMGSTIMQPAIESIEKLSSTLKELQINSPVIDYNEKEVIDAEDKN